jgi:hypothetical protein
MKPIPSVSQKVTHGVSDIYFHHIHYIMQNGLGKLSCGSPLDTTVNTSYTTHFISCTTVPFSRPALITSSQYAYFLYATFTAL